VGASLLAKIAVLDDANQTPEKSGVCRFCRPRYHSPHLPGDLPMLNGLWLGFFIVAAVSALVQWLVGGNAGIFAAMVESIFAMAKLSVEVMVLLFGTLTLWLGFLRIAEKAGIVDWLAKALGPLFLRLMPEVPAGHPAIGLITLNFAANGLGLDNAATPIGLKAMRALQDLNPSPTIASNAQILFLVLNASSLTLLPVTIFMYRASKARRTRPWCSCRSCSPPAPRPWWGCCPWRSCNGCACGIRWCWPI
jgi:spore maturation protein SpmA